MRVVHRYVIMETMKYFFMILAAVVGIYLLFDFFERIDDILDSDLSIYRGLVYFCLRIPLIVSQVAPVGMLLSVIIVFGLMVENNESVALHSGGISIYYLARSVLAVSLVLGVLVYLFNEVLVPVSMADANEIWRHEVKKEQLLTSKRKDIWIKSHRAIFHIKYYSPADTAIFGITLNYFDENFRLVRRIDAEEGIYIGGTWRLFGVIQQDLVKGEGRYNITHQEESPSRLEFVPEDLKKVVKKGEEMSYSELSTYIRDIENEGYDATTYRVDLWAKIAFPFVCLIMGIIGTGLPLWRKRQEGLAGSLFYGIGLAFIYWTLHSFSMSLGYGRILPPVVAAWVANVVFFLLGGYILFKAS
jgi:lipopolysaccharide export system permease protein